MTLPERILWSKLKDGRLGFRVYAQSVVLGYILDFWIPSAGICIEVDGRCHDSRREYDLKRDLVLGGRGIVTMRFKAAEVIANASAVSSLIKNKAKKRFS
jgi:very-short-patch-repair endonuclease